MDLRKQRPAMVQSKDQYILLHRAIAQMFQHYLQTMVGRETIRILPFFLSIYNFTRLDRERRRTAHSTA